MKRPAIILFLSKFKILNFGFCGLFPAAKRFSIFVNFSAFVPNCPTLCAKITNFAWTNQKTPMLNYSTLCSTITTLLIRTTSSYRISHITLLVKNLNLLNT